jgi:hypothetical protein
MGSRLYGVAPFIIDKFAQSPVTETLVNDSHFQC